MSKVIKHKDGTPKFPLLVPFCATLEGEGGAIYWPIPRVQMTFGV